MAEILNGPKLIRDEVAHRATTMSHERRELMLAVMDGDYDLVGTLHLFSRYRHCDTFLRWLLVNRYTGRSLRDILVRRFRGRVDHLVDYIVRESKGKTGDRSKIS